MRYPRHQRACNFPSATQISQIDTAVEELSMEGNGETPGRPEGVSVDRIRIVKPTDNWDAVLEFYKNGLGLRRFSSFKNHDGYDDVMLGMPDESLHLE
jgi:hypothetical protein